MATLDFDHDDKTDWDELYWDLKILEEGAKNNWGMDFPSPTRKRKDKRMFIIALIIAILSIMEVILANK